MNPPDGDSGDRSARAALWALRDGDPAGLETLFREHYPGLVRTARRWVGDASVAEDVVQEVFSTLWEKRHALEVRSSVGAYLHRAVRNGALNRHRRAALESRFEERVRRDPSLLEPVSGVAGPDPGLPSDPAGLRPELERALAALPPRRREAMTLRWLEGLSYREVAEVMGIAPKSVENELARGLADLRKALRPEAPEG